MSDQTPEKNLPGNPKTHSQYIDALEFHQILPVFNLMLKGCGNKAALLHAIHFSIKSANVTTDRAGAPRKTQFGRFIYGRRWVFHSHLVWNRMVLSGIKKEETVGAYFKELCDLGILKREKLSRIFHDIRKNPTYAQMWWYTIDYEVFDERLEQAHIGQKALMNEVEDPQFWVDRAEARKSKAQRKKEAKDKKHNTTLRVTEKREHREYVASSQAPMELSTENKKSTGHVPEEGGRVVPAERGNTIYSGLFHKPYLSNYKNIVRFYESAQHGKKHWGEFTEALVKVGAKNQLRKILINGLALEDYEAVYVAYTKKKNPKRFQAVIAKNVKSKEPMPPAPYMLDSIVYKFYRDRLFDRLRSNHWEWPGSTKNPTWCDPENFLKNKAYDQPFADHPWLEELLAAAWDENDGQELWQTWQLNSEYELQSALAFVFCKLEDMPVSIEDSPGMMHIARHNNWLQSCAKNDSQAILLQSIQSALTEYRVAFGYENCVSPWLARVNKKEGPDLDW